MTLIFNVDLSILKEFKPYLIWNPWHSCSRPWMGTGKVQIRSRLRFVSINSDMTSSSKSSKIKILYISVFVEVQYSNNYFISAKSCFKHSLLQLILGSNANWSNTSLLNNLHLVTLQGWYTNFSVSNYDRESVLMLVLNTHSIHERVVYATIV